MECPKCAGELETKTHGEDISLKRCSVCYGLLVRPDVLARKRAERNIETNLDIGSKSIGRKFDKVDDIQCPHCNVTLDKIVDSDQTHIWMETCPRCDRIFLDAGEFTDLKTETFTDKIKDLLEEGAIS